MYKKIQNRQAELTDFNQPLGFKINPLNRWVIKASTIPWDAIEERYASLFPSHTGPAAKPLRMALGSLLIQKKYGLSAETAQLLIKKYALEGFLRNLKDKYPLTVDQTADTIVDGLIAFYNKKSTSGMEE